MEPERRGQRIVQRVRAWEPKSGLVNQTAMASREGGAKISKTQEHLKLVKPGKTGYLHNVNIPFR
jgi:hypothetical protein